MGGKKKTTVGYRYAMGLHFALCHGPIDRLIEIRAGKRTAWSTALTASGAFTFAKPDLFGGDAREGGISGPAHLLMGDGTQTLPSDISSKMGGLAVAFRGLTTLYFNGRFTSNNPYAKPWEFRVRRIIKGWSIDGEEVEAWYPEKAEVQVESGLTDDVRAAFSGLKWELPCTSSSGGDTCPCPGISNDSAALALPADEVYQVTFRIRGVSELVSYSGGTVLSPSFFYRDKTGWSPSPVNVYGLEISDPPGDYYVNNGAFDITTPTVLDYEITVPIRGGATVALRANSIDGFQVNNNGGLSAPDDDPEYPITVTQPYDGQFIQLDPVRIEGLGKVAMNPAHIVYQALVDDRLTLAFGSAQINDTAFRAAADAFHAEGLGLCLEWNQQTPIGDFIQQVLEHCRAILYVDPEDGLFVLKPLRADYDVESLPTFGEDQIIAYESFAGPSADELASTVQVVYRDIETGEDSTVTVQNLGVLQQQFGAPTETAQLPGLPTAELAARAAQAILDEKSLPLKRHRVRLTRAASGLKPGDVISLTWPQLGISGAVVRVLAVSRGTLREGAVLIEGVDDVYGFPATSYISPQPVGYEPFDPAPAPIVTQAVIELPYWTAALYEGPAFANAVDVDSGFLAPIAARNAANAQVYRIYSRISPAEYEDQDIGNFVPYAALDGSIDEQATTLTLTGDVDLDEVEAGDVAIIGTGRLAEWVLITGITISPPTLEVSRGVLDTTPQAHTGGSPVFVTDGFASQDSTERATGQTVDFKLATISTGGELDIALATEVSSATDQRIARPYPPGNVAINGEAYPAGTVTGVLTITWAHRDRQQQTAYVVEQTEGDIGPEAGTTYNVYAYDAGTDALLDSDTGLTGTSWVPTIAGSYLLRIEIESERDAITSWQRQIRTFAYEGASSEDGLGLITEGGALIRFE